MVTYIYFVKCPNCEDEHFDFFDDAKAFALSCLSQKPVITQTEVCRNDFGECTDHSDLGTIWSWEDECKDAEGGYTGAEPTKSIFTKDDLKRMADGQDPEFDDDDFFFNNSLVEDAARRISFKNTADYDEFIKLCKEIGIFTGADLNRFMQDREADDGNLLDKLREYKAELDSIEESCERKPIPEGMTIEQLVEEMEENEDTVECTWCEELFDKSECRYEVDLGWLCSRCEMAIKSRGETLTFREGNYWDFLDEDITAERSIEELVRDSINHLVNDLGKDSDAEDFADDVILDIERNYDNFVPETPENHSKWASAIACEVSRQLNEKLDIDFSQVIDSSDMEIWGVEPVGDATYKAVLLKRYKDVPFRGAGYPDEIEKVESELFDLGGLFVFHFGKDGLPALRRWDPELLRSLGTCEIIFEDERYDQACEKVFNYSTPKLDENVKEIHDLGNEYDGGYPIETPEVSDSHLKLCPECGKEAFDIETGICVECGFN